MLNAQPMDLYLLVTVQTACENWGRTHSPVYAEHTLHEVEGLFGHFPEVAFLERFGPPKFREFEALKPWVAQKHLHLALG